jgi:RHS repeat-associated protein
MHNLCRIRGKAGNMLKKMSRHGRVHTPRTPQTEIFLWDGLALIRRNDEHFINEPHVGNAPKKLRFEGKPRAQRSARRARKGPRGNPVASSNGTSYFNDALGTTVGAKKDGKYSAAALSAFGENLSVDSPTPTQNSNFFTGKPYVEGLGHAFLMRNYRASLAKWQTADPMGYPDGWNQLAYCNNTILCCVDVIGAWKTSAHSNFFKYSIWYDGRRMKDKYLNLIVSADKAVDEDQSVENAYIHAMKTYSQTAEEANILINSCIEGHIVNAEDTALCYVNGIDSLDVVTAAEIIVRELGAASHTYQDRTCPAHYDSATNSPHTWFGTWLIDWRHFPELFLYVPNASIREYKSWIEALFHRVLLGNIDLINEIFE